MKISQVRYGIAKILQKEKELQKFRNAEKELRIFRNAEKELRKFRKRKRICEIFASEKDDAKISQVKKVVVKISSVLRKFCKWLQNSSVLDSSSDSLPCTLDWFGKGFEALQNLDSSCNLASILLCHGLYQVLPHSWLVLMIKKLSKTSKLAKTD